MSFKKLLLAASIAFATTACSSPTHAQSALISTNQGDITVELNERAAPKTVANFVRYAQSGFYTNVIFHRVIPNFMIQTGAFTTDMVEKSAPFPTIANEAFNGLKNDKYTIAMARTGEPHSASAQFFINTKTNDFLNHTSQTQQGWGYAVFGRVTSGFDVVDKIGKVYTQTRKGYDDVPIANVIVTRVTILPN
jgi:cyclophilin family peptidyl-prolyl cis-trans isomerase